ncbi:MAG TPA: cupredoxin domain-containing protein [Candidatus Bathyarchaeia archaeon]|nr:cupredoxin domain-containing protein [Candidatus Bathyarchaeia archaeon]
MSQRKFISGFFIGLIFLISVPFAQHSGLIPKAQAATINITLYAYFSGWNNTKPSGANPTITVTQGDTISFNLIEGDASTHRFLLDIDNSSITNDCANPGPDKCSGDITTTQGSSISSFAVMSTPGTYFYYCTYHSPAYMVGKFVIKASTAPDFTIMANPAAIGPINTRVVGTSTVTVAPTNGFGGTVTLTTSPSSGLNASISPASISTASGTATLSVNSTTAGSYSVTVTGTASSGTHSVTVTVTVVAPDFKITLRASTLTVAPGSSGNVVVTLTSLNGFSGTVSLTAIISPLGPQATFSPASVAVSTSGPVNSTLSASAASSGAYSSTVSQGNYNINVTGTSGQLVHPVTLALTVGSTSSVLSNVAIIGGGIAAAIAIIAGTVYVMRRRSKTKT